MYYSDELRHELFIVQVPCEIYQLNGSLCQCVEDNLLSALEIKEQIGVRESETFPIVAKTRPHRRRRGQNRRRQTRGPTGFNSHMVSHFVDG